MAPMVNQSELAFRMMVRKYNPKTLCYSPMINSNKFVNFKSDKIFTTCAKDRPLVI